MNHPDDDLAPESTPLATESGKGTLNRDQAGSLGLATAGSVPDAFATQVGDPLETTPIAELPWAAEGNGPVIAGKYTLIELIGEGGMGAVYRARQTEPVKREVALKLIAKHCREPEPRSGSPAQVAARGHRLDRDEGPGEGPGPPR